MPGDRPTLDTVAAAAGVSRMTVSNAYNRPDQLSTATRERVLAAAAELGYAGPDPTAASLRLGRTGTVGVMLTERLPYAFADPGLLTILHGIATELSATGHALLLVPSIGVDTPALLRTSMVDALILCSLPADDPGVRAARDRGVPLVTVGTPRLPHTPRVGPDNRAAAATVAEHLVSLGHRRFAILSTAVDPGTGPVRPIFEEREDGYRRALVAAGLPDPAVLRSADNSRASGRATVRAHLGGADPDGRATAILAVTDILALGGLDAAREVGLAVPDQLSMAGFDDIEAAATSTPPLTTIDHALFEQGRVAARLALRRVAGEQVRAPHITARLVVRASTGAAPAVAHRHRHVGQGDQAD